MNHQIQKIISLATNKFYYYKSDDLYFFWKDKIIVKNSVLQNSNLVNFNEFEKLCNDVTTLYCINYDNSYPHRVNGKTTKIILESIKYVIDHNEYVLVIINNKEYSEYSVKSTMRFYLKQIESTYNIDNIAKKIKFFRLNQAINLEIIGIDFGLVLLDFNL